jgi:hypothetical protein
MRRILLVLLTSLAVFAQSFVGPPEYSADIRTGSEIRSAAYLTGAEYIVPQLIVGGEWTSTLRLVNNGNATITPHNAYFLDSEGRPMFVTYLTSNQGYLTQTAFRFAIAPGQMVEIPFYGGAQTQFGQIVIDPTSCPLQSTCSLYGEVVLRNRNPTRPDFESVFALEAPARDQFLLWDHRGYFGTTLYLANANNSQTTVTLDFRDMAGAQIISDFVTLPALGTRIIYLNVWAPETLGYNGTLLIQATNSFGEVPLVTATALRINPSNSFTPLKTYVTKTQPR